MAEVSFWLLLLRQAEVVLVIYDFMLDGLYTLYIYVCIYIWAFQVMLVERIQLQCRRYRFTSGSERILLEEALQPLQFSCLEYSMDRVARVPGTVHMVAESDTTGGLHVSRVTD